MGEYLVCLDELSETIGVLISGKVKQKRGKWREGIVRRTQLDVGFEDEESNATISRSYKRKGNRFFPKASRVECSSSGNIFIYTQ